MVARDTVFVGKGDAISEQTLNILVNHVATSMSDRGNPVAIL